jgi:hypothetical protein
MTFQKQVILKKYHLSDNEMSVPEAEGKIEKAEIKMSKFQDISESRRVSDQMSEAELSSRDTSEQGQMYNQQVSDQMSDIELSSGGISKTGQMDNQQMSDDQMSESELSNKMSDKKTSHDKMSLDQKSGMSHPDNFNKDNSKPDRQPEFELLNKDNSKPDNSTKLKVIPLIGHIISPSGEEEEATFDSDDNSTNQHLNSTSIQISDTSTNRHFNSKSTQNNDTLTKLNLFDNDDTSTNRHFNSKSTQQKLQKNSATINDISNQEELTKFGKETLSQEAQ